MKTRSNALIVSVTFLFFTVAAGCEGNKDKIIKADLGTKADSQKEFIGVNFTVENGIVTLTGVCPSEKSRATVESTAKGLYGVKAVINKISIAPVVIGTDELLKHSVDSVLKQYSQVVAITKDSIVRLEGTLNGNEAKKLTAAIESLKPKMIEQKLTVR